MKLLLVCDDTIVRHNGKYYFPNQERFDFYQRYLRVFEELRLCARAEDEKTLKKSRIPIEKEPRLEYLALPDFHGPKQYVTKYYSVGKVLKRSTETCVAAVLRLPSTVAQRACKFVKKEGIPYAVEVVFDSHDGLASAKKLYLKVLYYRIYKQLVNTCRHADGVACVTEHYLQQRYYSTKPNAFTSNYSSLALDKSFYSAPRLFPDKKEFVIAHTAKQVMFNGRKGHNELIHAVKILKDEGFIVHVNFAGADYNNGVERLSELVNKLGLQNQIHFMGFLSREELDKYLSDADMYVMPTKAEGLPRVIIEAMAKGLPCITTPVSGNPELLSEHFLVNYDDVSLLSERIKELISDKSVYENASKTNFENSLKYEASVLQERRDAFYGKLKNIVKS